MLPANLRLKLPPSWNRNFPDLQANSKIFKVIAKETKLAVSSKVGFIISTKVGKAVIRNRLRRKLEKLLRGRLEESRAGLELIIIAHPGSAQANDEEISTNLNQVLSKIHFR